MEHAATYGLRNRVDAFHRLEEVVDVQQHLCASPKDWLTGVLSRQSTASEVVQKAAQLCWHLAELLENVV